MHLELLLHYKTHNTAIILIKQNNLKIQFSYKKMQLFQTVVWNLKRNHPQTFIN